MVNNNNKERLEKNSSLLLCDELIGLARPPKNANALTTEATRITVQSPPLAGVLTRHMHSSTGTLMSG